MTLLYASTPTFASGLSNTNCAAFDALFCTNAICVPSSEIVGEVVTVPPVLYAHAVFTGGAPDVPPHGALPPAPSVPMYRLLYAMMLAWPIMPPVSVPFVHAKLFIVSVAVMLFPPAPAVFAVIMTTPLPPELAVIAVNPTLALNAVIIFVAIMAADSAFPLLSVMGTY